MSLVNELQVSAEQDDVLTVLRKTKRLASKLARQDIADWLRWEHDGYPADQPVPDYRNIAVTLAYRTNGYVPAGYGMVKDGTEDLPCVGFNLSASLRLAISEVLQMIEAVKAGNGIYFPIDERSDVAKEIRSMYSFSPMYAQQITLMEHWSGPKIQAVPERIKDKVLDWACALEAAGVNGEGVSFDEKEKHIAHSIVFNISDSHIEQLNSVGSNRKGR